MDNFILYDEICKTDHSIIYKGRRKGSINFVAIHCIEKILRPEITNLVRLTYEMSHKNTVKFYEWYETSNHLWLVVELCTAGTLDILLEQDGCLPESSIKQFGIDLCEGLFYIHSLGLLFCDLIPRKIMIDGNGTLKLSDFGLAKLEGEDLETIFQETFDTTSTQWTDQAASSSTKSPVAKIYKKPFGEIKALAPEILQGEDNTKESDLWSLGCLLYQMYTGSLPFVSEDLEQLRHMIISKELPNPKGNKLSTKPSSDFLSLIKGLLEKDPCKRFKWKQILKHPFWDQKLKHLLPTKSIIVDGKEKIVDLDDDEENENISNENDDKLNTLAFSTDRPRTAAGLSTIFDQSKQPEVNVSFSISSRLPTSPQSTVHTRNALQYKDSEEPNISSSSTSTITSQQQNDRTEKFDVSSNINMAARNDLKRLFFLANELNTSQIIDNPKIQKPASLKYEPKVLPFTNQKLFKAETFLKLPKDEFEKSLETIRVNTNVPSDKSAGAIKLKLHLMNYIGTICTESSKLADAFVHVDLYRDLILIIKNGHNLEMKMKASRIVAILFNKAKKLDSSKEFTEVIQSLIDLISSNRKDAKFKQILLPALGELLYFICRQESLQGKSVETWNVPSSAYVLIVKNIGEDPLINHIVCKIIENIATTNSPNVQKLLSNQSEVVNGLWFCYTHSANNEQLRVSALNALCMLSSHSINVFSSLIEKTGVDAILECLSSGNSEIQHVTLTMICMLSNEQNLKNLPEKKLVPKLVSIYESTNVTCRAKAYMLTYILLKQQNDLLLTFSESKLVNSIERDNRKNFPIKEENDYMHNTINTLVETILAISFAILDENISALESVNGRKNPSANQTKQLKRCIPNASVLKALILTQTFRSKLFNEKFLGKFSKLISLSKPLNNGELNLDNICSTEGVMAEFIDSVISILECLVQRKEIVNENTDTIMKCLLPSLIDNIDSSNSDLRVESLKVFSEITNIFLNKQNEISREELRRDMKKFIENHFIEIVDKLLLQPEPLPFFSLSIMQSVLNYDITLISTLKVRNILPCIFKLLQNYKNKIGSTLVVKLLNILNIWSSTIDPSDLYENNIIDFLKPMLVDISKKRLSDKIVTETLIELLRIADNLLKYVSEFVKKALQAKKANAPVNDGLANQAEKLLHSNKPLVVSCSFLISLLVNEDADLNDLSCKILWIIMQLFGSECKDLVNQENINILLASILNSNSKRQKILLRIVKRLITSDKQNLETFKTIGQNFIESMKVLKNNANAEANVSLSSMIDEILKLA